MNPVFSGLFSALTYGVSDFLAGLASRHDSPLRVVALSHTLSAVALVLLAVGLGQPMPGQTALLWGAGAGLLGMGAVVAFYRALALGPMGAVSVGAGALSAVVPVGAGLLAGESLGRLGSLGALGVLLGTALLSFRPGGAGKEGNSGVGLGLLAGLGFGMFFLLLGQAQSPGVLWVLAAARATSALLSLMIAASTVGLRPRAPALILAAFPGDMLGSLFYLIAVQGGGLALGALFSSLYPAFTTLMAVAVLRERLRAAQWVGVGFALVGAVLLSQR
ncbi:DMT family transporter [Deinococcus radiodurans]|jgi:EamA-like transporter family.|nr:DMT family transporter [Deinococcus radiodurans]ANC70526.1 hypothetical protein A2G07_01400 [Deinococcus radiodurans R1 = ATCC 13939 = DSM 20539]QIP28092.1 DMT family transporter [Deinococcus radiodurans]QIP31028.1 DMT family transporter [Deinococcus radiodurans]UID71394.1 hypothetical protein DRO_2410 [Deinococcus radiodurans R1 = ATCC 13939 = DSM 20539]UTA51735.1 DMT family transporter [Deinococcus radiodurans]